MLIAFLVAGCDRDGGASPAPTATASPAPTATVSPAPTATASPLQAHNTHPGESFVAPDAITTCHDAAADESWPPYEPRDEWAGLVEQAKARYLASESVYEPHLQEYTSTGNYLNYGVTQRWEADRSLQFDDAGVPLVDYEGTFHYNPVTVSQFALTVHGRVMNGTATQPQFLAAVDRLLSLQDERGAFPNSYGYTYYLTGERLEPGWTSAMSQGMALSVLRRAYADTNDERYREAGDRALAFLVTPRSEGGLLETLYHLDPSLDRFLWFPEYPTGRPYYTLNGFMFVLLGLYDWSEMPGSSEASPARELFDCGMETLHHLLPYYDVGGYTAYDLGHVMEDVRPNVQAEYHAIHIYLIHALNAVVDAPVLRDAEAAWRSQVDGLGR